MKISMSLTYLSIELKRSYRNARYMLFTLGIPLVLFLVIGNAWNTNIGGGSGQTWYMVNMGMFGSMGAVLGVGARIAVERDAGWNRQLRLTPLPALAYVVGKVVTGMLLALPALLLVDLAGALSGNVHLTALQWTEVVGLGWISVLPLAVVGVGVGYAARGDSAQAVNGGLVMLMALVCGTRSVKGHFRSVPALAWVSWFVVSRWKRNDASGQVMVVLLVLVGLSDSLVGVCGRSRLVWVLGPSFVVRRHDGRWGVPRVGCGRVILMRPGTGLVSSSAM